MLNLLHPLALLAIAGCLVALWRERTGIARSRGFLMVAPPLAFVCVLLTMGLAEPDLRRPDLLRIALAAGCVLGGARGLLMAIEVDPLWSTVRMPRGGDGFWVAAVMALLVLLATAAPLVAATGRELVPYATAAIALGAGFVAGRAATLYLRSRR